MNSGLPNSRPRDLASIYQPIALIQGSRGQTGKEDIAGNKVSGRKRESICWPYSPKPLHKRTLEGHKEQQSRTCVSSSSKLAFIGHQDSIPLAMESLHIQAHLAHPALASDASGSSSPIYPSQGLCPCFHAPGSEPFIQSTFYPTLIPQGQLR